MSHGPGILWPGHGCFVCRVWLDNKSLVLLSRSLSRGLLRMYFWKAQFRWYPTELKIAFKTCASTFNDIQCKMCMLFVRYTGLDLVVIYCHFMWFRMVDSSISPSTDIQKLKHLRWRPIDHLARSTGSEAQIGFRCIWMYTFTCFFCDEIWIFGLGKSWCRIIIFRYFWMVLYWLICFRCNLVEVGMPMIAYFVAKDMAAYIEALWTWVE